MIEQVKYLTKQLLSLEYKIQTFGFKTDGSLMVLLDYCKKSSWLNSVINLITRVINGKQGHENVKDMSQYLNEILYNASPNASTNSPTIDQILFPSDYTTATST